MPPDNNNASSKNLNTMQMSPSCNQVSSTTDVNKGVQTDGNNHGSAATMHGNDLLECNLNSITTDNLIENLSSISMETIHGNMLSPTALMARSTSQNSFMDGKMTSQSNSSYHMDTSNMVVNDMSSMLASLPEENKFLSMRWSLVELCIVKLVWKLVK